MFIQVPQDIIDNLEKVCPKCEGSASETCELCRDGKVPTELGQALLDLVRKYQS